MNKCDEEMSFAPVIIPTLCRYEHFKKCIESLAKCVGAEDTEVYIGLDYPAKDSHWEGYEKIKKYLDDCKLTFKSINVIERKHNFGFGPNGNSNALRNEVLKKYDKFIFSEDDNFFSPNFLRYMNKGLNLFEKDKSVFAINGYRHDYPIKSADNTFFRQNVNFSAWGYGIWRDRIEKLPSLDYFQKKFTLKEFFRTQKEIGANRAFDYWQYFFQPRLSWHDSSYSVYSYLENMDIIMPSKVSLVRNMGWDASGEHCNAKQELCQKFLGQSISRETEFEYNGTGFEYYQENRILMKSCSYAKISGYAYWKKFIKNLLLYAIKNG